VLMKVRKFSLFEFECVGESVTLKVVGVRGKSDDRCKVKVVEG
jgi:hypothetical protein